LRQESRRRRAGEAEEKKKKGRGRGEADRWGRFISVRGKKEKEEEGDGPLREGVDGRWAAGLKR
jgi:hypothetical protein